MSNPTTNRGGQFFQGASGVHVHGGTMIVNEPPETTEYLNSQVAPNAILNEGGRADAVGCYPGTREDVISSIEAWMATGYRDDRHIFWLSGPAGAGKSAIMQTLAENGLLRTGWMAQFFFFRADATRNHLSSVVPTLLYQLTKYSPTLLAIVRDILGKDPLVLKRSFRSQFMQLIDGPIRSIRRASPGESPIILVIDALDECGSENEPGSDQKNTQSNFLAVLHDVVTAPESPFIAIVASRVESHIEMAFNGVGQARGSISLAATESEQDIRRYITEKMLRIKTMHPLRRHLDAEWPAEYIVDSIVTKASNQFLYAATVVRFIEHSPESPAFAMELVLNTRPSKEHSPFAEMDAIYTLVLSRSKHWDTVRNLIALADMYGHRSFTSDSFRDYYECLPLAAIELSVQEVESIFADLTPIMETSISSWGDLMILFYHRSFMDFLRDPERAGRFYVDRGYVANLLAPSLFLKASDRKSLTLAFHLFWSVDKRGGHALTNAFKNAHPRIPINYPDTDLEALFSKRSRK